MRKICLFICSLLFCGNLLAAGLNEIVFFGDSLTDNGNLYNLIKIIPKSPPYYNGRFTNGPTWAESFGAYYEDKFSIFSNNYAYGGATVLFHNPTNKFEVPITLEGELYEHYASSLFSDKSKNLYVIWIGANDYLLDEETDADILTTEVVDKISETMFSLIGQGARYFLIINLPDLAKTPFADLSKTRERLHLLSVLHNEKIAKAIKSFNDLDPDLKIIPMDIYEIFNDVLANTDKYNQQYNTQLTVLDQACWLGGVTFRKYSAKERNELTAQLQKINFPKNRVQGNNFSPQTLTDYILNSPGLKQTYVMGHWREEGLTPCEHPEQYVFWDLIHPSAVIHQMISTFAIEILNNQAKDLFTA